MISRIAHEKRGDVFGINNVTERVAGTNNIIQPKTALNFRWIDSSEGDTVRAKWDNVNESIWSSWKTSAITYSILPLQTADSDLSPCSTRI